MKTCCLVCKENTENKDAKVIKTKHNRLLLLSKCSVCGIRKTRFIKNEQEAKGLFSSLGIRTPLSTIPGLNILF